MTNNEIAKIIENFLSEQYKRIRELDSIPGTGGKIRDISGKITETLVEMIWNFLAENHPEVNAEIFVGSEKPYKVINPNGHFIEESVDRHCYINGKLVLAIECKTYLDKCYMQRADSDFDLMKSYDNNFKGIIVSIENSIADNSYNFFMDRGKIDNVYYLATGKRNSSKLKKICYHEERIQHELILTLINDIEKFFN